MSDDWCPTNAGVFEGPGCRRCGDQYRHRKAETNEVARFISLGIYTCPTCGNKRCPKATWHGHKCTGSNEPNQNGEPEQGALDGWVGEWPHDDQHLRGGFWHDDEGKVWVHGRGGWKFWHNDTKRWDAGRWNTPGTASPWVRTIDPSQPRTYVTLTEVDGDVERATGMYSGLPRDLARSELSKSGWMQRVHDGLWKEIPVNLIDQVTHIKETPRKNQPLLQEDNDE